MSIEYIRQTYQVPAKRGGRVNFLSKKPHRRGTITGTRGQYLLVRFDGEKKSSVLHPTWAIDYEDDQRKAKTLA